jgi:superfamily II DNA or RNA helicase
MATIELQRGSLALIQAPPGTGKSLLEIFLVANLIERYPSWRILICAPSNAASDMIAERLAKVNCLAGKIIRLQSKKNEDLLNMTSPENAKPDTMVHILHNLSDEDKDELLAKTVGRGKED